MSKALMTNWRPIRDYKGIREQAVRLEHSSERAWKVQRPWDTDLFIFEDK